MSFIILVSIFLQNSHIILGSYLPEASNYMIPDYKRPQLERNNIVNKGVWVRNPKERLAEKIHGGEFIFRTNSLDMDSLLQNNFDAFGENGMQDLSGITNYAERLKRSASHERKVLLQESLKDCAGDKECLLQRMEKKSSFGKSKLISKLRPASVFNDYPYEVAILLGDNQIEDNNARRVKESGNDNTVIPPNNNQNPPQVNIDNLVKTESKIETTLNDNENSSVIPKRSMKKYENEVIKKIEIIEELNPGNATNKVDRDIFEKEERIWHQNMPISDPNVYKIMPKNPIQKNKPVNERGLIKVLSMLTKTFKKTMKQHSDIKKIHNKLHMINDEVSRNMVEMNKKFKDMEEKYHNIVSISEKMNLFESTMNMKEEYLKAKESEMSKNLIEFENQQKKFLTQQRQFYNIQKLMLAQNEKINMKQNLIAKTQSEISHRQNNFARILKKAKQIYIDKQMTTKYPSTTVKPKPINNETEEPSKITHTTTQAPLSTESIKINLFSIPALNKLVNQDSLILKEKDEQPVDDLVYKYYFNNTFIDNLMKSKILSTFTTTAENSEIARNAKNKRDEEELEKTILLPVNKVNNEGTLTRQRRWIHHQSQAKLRRRHRGKNSISNVDIDDGKPLKQSKDGKAKTQFGKATKLIAKDKASPFKTMAKKFCTEIGQNENDQMLAWCVEKALRRLQYMETKMPLPFPITDTPKGTKKETTTTPMTTPTVVISTVIPSSTTPASVAPTVKEQVTQQTSTAKDNLIFFPDNDELESNLKEFDLTPDTEGNIYYDGSLHASNIVGLMDSDGFSDIMPGLDSNSKVEIDPQTFDYQARRRNFVKRMSANIVKNVMYG